VEAIRSAAGAPGTDYNPLTIVGRSGTGKTHLLHAFGHELRNAGLARVAVIDGAQFVEALVSAIGDDSIGRWRQRLRRLDALLIDDVSAFAGKERSQEELYLLYNLMLESNRQMAFTSPVAPGALEGFEERLVTRLSGGLVVELGVPDREARRREVERLLGPAIPDQDLVEYLASRQAASLREVQQMVQRVTTASDGQDVPLSLENARRLLDGELAPPARPIRRGSGLIAPGSGALRSGEKMIESWPDIGERLIEGWN
jgi:chromosomal replication initiator protein